MSVNRIALETRLDRIKKGYAGDPAFVPCVINKMADMPLAVFMATAPAEREQLRELLEITEEKENVMTYRETALYLCQMLSRHDSRTITAVNLLAAPVLKCYEERKCAYGKSNEDTA